MYNINEDFEKMENLERKLGIEFCSCGLAPNPNGYCYEILVDKDAFDKALTPDLKKTLDYVCNCVDEGYFEWLKF